MLQKHSRSSFLQTEILLLEELEVSEDDAEMEVFEEPLRLHQTVALSFHSSMNGKHHRFYLINTTKQRSTREPQQIAARLSFKQARCASIILSLHN